MVTSLVFFAAGASWLAVLAALTAGRIPIRVAGAARAATLLTALGALAALGLLMSVGMLGPVTVALGSSVLALRIDGLAATMLVLVLGLSAIIQSFAERYLRGDLRQGWFVASANLLTAATVMMATADTLLLFGLAWLLSGAALLLVLATYVPEPQAVLGVRAALLRLTVGDSALVIALLVILTALGWGASFGDLARASQEFSPLVLALLGVLLVLPALARASQVPLHGWLPRTLAAPTPASALMHAGVVNAGAILIIRFTPLVGATAPAMQLLFAAGAVTLVYAALLRMTKADIKGRLVFSTMAQMGFMLMTCSLGALAAAVFHLVAHGLYKSALFLSAGSAVQQATRARQWPSLPRPTRTATLVALVVAVLLGVCAVFGARLLVWPEITGPSLALLLSVVITAGVSLSAALNARWSWGTAAAGALVIGALALSYTFALRALTGFLGDPPVPSAAVSPWWLIVPGVLVLALQILRQLPDTAPRLRDLIYARALTAASPTRVPLRPAPSAVLKGN